MVSVHWEVAGLSLVFYPLIINPGESLIYFTSGKARTAQIGKLIQILDQSSSRSPRISGDSTTSSSSDVSSVPSHSPLSKAANLA